MASPRLQHVSIPIPPDGVERARAFYGGLLGLEERDVPPRLDPARFVWYRAGRDDLELHLMLTGEPPPDRPHLCLAVPDAELDALRRRLQAAGVATRDGTEIVGRRRFTCRDPFGNLLELASLDAGSRDLVSE